MRWPTELTPLPGAAGPDLGSTCQNQPESAPLPASPAAGDAADSSSHVSCPAGLSQRQHSEQQKLCPAFVALQWLPGSVAARCPRRGSQPLGWMHFPAEQPKVRGTFLQSW